MKIPKTFQLFGNTIKVEIDVDKMDSASAYGQAQYKTDTVTLSNKAHGEPICKAEIETSLFHEIVHMVLRRTSHKELGEDEKFVDLIARSLHQVMTTMKY